VKSHTSSPYDAYITGDLVDPAASGTKRVLGWDWIIF
jgi:hypothetical protein